MTQQLEKRNTSIDSPSLTVGELISQLDSERDYGKPYEDICDAVRNGVLLLYEGHPVPVIKDATTGRTHKGSGQWPNSGRQGKESLSDRLRARGEEDAELVYEWILDSAANGNSKAQIWFLEKFSGKPVEERVRKDPTAMAALVASLREPTFIQVEEYIEAEIIDE